MYSVLCTPYYCVLCTVYCVHIVYFHTVYGVLCTTRIRSLVDNHMINDDMGHMALNISASMRYNLCCLPSNLESIQQLCGVITIIGRYVLMDLDWPPDFSVRLQASNSSPSARHQINVEIAISLECLRACFLFMTT